jgi:hypothetical protein
VAAPVIQAGPGADPGAGPGAVQLVYRRLFTAGNEVLTAGSVPGACAPDVAALITVRQVQGAGSGLVASRSCRSFRPAG